MAICRNCGQKISWYLFKRDLCSECVKSWKPPEEETKLPSSETSEPENVSGSVDYYDLNNLLSSIHIKEVAHEETDLFTRVWAPRGYSIKPFIASASIHAGLVCLIYGMSGLTWQQPLPLTREALEREYNITYYRPSDLLPAIRSPKEGPKTPAGRKKNVMPPKGSTAFHPTQIVQSAPPKADNPSQTIVQPSTPNTVIKQEVKVPNIVIWNVEDTRIETIQMAQKHVSSLLNSRLNAPQALMKPPDPEMKNFERSLSELRMGKSEVLNQNPKLALAPGASPEWKIGSDPDGSTAKNVERSLSDVRIAKVVTLNQNSKLALAPGASPEWKIGPDSDSSTPFVNVPGALEGNGNLRNLVVLSANPGLPGPGGIRVPPGNRTGEFSISPDGNRTGSPNGIDGGELDGGVPGGGGSGKGSGNGYGSGGDIAQIQIPGVSVQGGHPDETPTIAGPGRRPRASVTFSKMVTIDEPGDSYNITVVEGRSGGAGLGVYGVLSGKRNYTVFVPMPGGRWIMQFSEIPESQHQPTVAPASGSQLYVSPGDTLVQPRPLRKVDPGRPEDEELARLRGMVVLYGVIRKDGGIEKVRVIRSLNPALDERAMEALKQWKFKPAKQNDTPIEVQALFGIPFRPQPGR
jgi:protein TonB